MSELLLAPEVAAGATEVVIAHRQGVGQRLPHPVGGALAVQWMAALVEAIHTPLVLLA